MAAQMFTAKEVANDLAIDPKALRKFIREQRRAADEEDTLPGQGGRYAFSPEEAEALKAAYLENAAKRAQRAPKEATTIEAEDLDTDAEDLEFEDLSEDINDVDEAVEVEG